MVTLILIACLKCSQYGMKGSQLNWSQKEGGKEGGMGVCVIRLVSDGNRR